MGSTCIYKKFINKNGDNFNIRKYMKHAEKKYNKQLEDERIKKEEEKQKLTCECGNMKMELYHAFCNDCYKKKRKQSSKYCKCGTPIIKEDHHSCSKCYYQDNPPLLKINYCIFKSVKS